MTLEQFIAENREEIDSCINRVLNHVPKEASCYCPKSRTEHTHTGGRPLDDEERASWVLNDEGLYSWAEEAGAFDDEEED